MAKHMPIVVAGFLENLWHGPSFFRTSVVAAVVKSVVDDDTEHVYAVGGIFVSKSVERLGQQRKPDGRKVLWPDRN